MFKLVITKHGIILTVQRLHTSGQMASGRPSTRGTHSLPFIDPGATPLIPCPWRHSSSHPTHSIRVPTLHSYQLMLFWKIPRSKLLDLFECDLHETSGQKMWKRSLYKRLQVATIIKRYRLHWLWISFFWDATPRHWVRGSRHFEATSTKAPRTVNSDTPLQSWLFPSSVYY